MDDPRLQELAHSLSNAITGEVRFDPYTRVLYSTDASAYQIEPLGVVLPRTRDDVCAVIEVAARYQVPVLARGGGSSLAGQAVGAAVVLDFSKYLNRVLEVDAEAGWVRAEPGVVCDGLNAALRPHGLMFGPDPASANRATVGGMLANNATGSHSILYGMAADHVLSVEALLDDGTTATFGPLTPEALAARCQANDRLGGIYRGLTKIVDEHAALIRERFPRTWRRASGYSLNYLLPPHGYTATQPPGWYGPGPYPPAEGFNVAQLLAGSEGTLAVITEAKLRCVRRPRQTGLTVLAFESVAAAAEATPTILECQPAGVELIDGVMIKLTRAVPAYARKLTFFDGDPAALLVVEYFGESERELTAQMDRLDAHLARQRVPVCGRPRRALAADEQANVWGVRKVGLGLLASTRGGPKPIAFMEDVAVPVERLGEYVRRVERLFSEFGVRSAYYAHASAGCLHIRPVLDLKTPDGVAKMKTIGEAVLETVVAMGGAMSGEHGDGLSRSAWNGRLFGPQLYEAFRAVKRLFDPAGRLNPGKVVDGPDLTHDLRYGPQYQARELPTHLSFTREGGFAAAVEQCNGAAVCRKLDGTMCPSFIATRDEEHSTRGRANALRAALAGRLPASALTSERMHAVLDLCLECKACKAECPSGVDMAKIKYEFLAQYQAVHGVPLRSRLFANLHRLSRLLQPAAALANPLLAFGPARWALERAVGIARQRQLPGFAAQTFRAWFKQHERSGRTAEPDPRPMVLFFVDTYTQFNQPEVGRAAVRVLEAAGYRVEVASHGCCGRPLISKGLLDQARQIAGRNVATLGPLAQAGVPIVGLEPSCLLTLRDEYLDLLPDVADAQQVARQALLVEEFLARLAEQGRLRLRFRPAREQQVLVHAHCYQKALPGTADLLRMLRLPGWAVTETNAGCCGMAGAFGYEAEHYALSQAIGGERLYPAVQAAAPTTLLAASGISCRQQIAHGTGRTARHPIELLADALA